MTQTEDFESQARDYFDADFSLRNGEVFYEPIVGSHLVYGELMPFIYEDVAKQLEAVAESFGVFGPPSRKEADRAYLGTLYRKAKEFGFTLVLVGSQVDPEEPIIPGLVAVFSDWPDMCTSMRTKTPTGSRLVHGLFASYDLLTDLNVLLLAVENLGNADVDPNKSTEYPACA